MLLLLALGCSDGTGASAPIDSAPGCCGGGPTLLAVETGGGQAITNAAGALAVVTVRVPDDADYLAVDATLIPEVEGFAEHFGYTLKVGPPGAAEAVLEEGAEMSCGGGTTHTQPLVLHYLHPVPDGARGATLTFELVGSAEPCNREEYTASIGLARMYVTAVRLAP